MPPHLAIRSAEPADYDGIVEVWAAAGLKHLPSLRDSREAFEAQLQRFATTYLVATEGNLVVGVLLGTHDTRKGWLNRLAVAPTHQRRGVAARLIEACEAAFRAQGLEIFSALVETDNRASTATFDASGYRRDIPVYYFHKRLHPDV